MSGGSPRLRPWTSKIVAVASGFAAASAVGRSPLHPAVLLTFVIATAAVRLAIGVIWERR